MLAMSRTPRFARTAAAPSARPAALFGLRTGCPSGVLRCSGGDPVTVGPTVWRVVREGVPGRGGEIAERLGGFGVQPQYVLTESLHPREAAVEGCFRIEHCGQRDDVVIINLG